MTSISVAKLVRWVAAAALTLSLAFATALPAQSQEIAPDQLALARKYVDLTNKAGIYEASLLTVATATSKLLSQQNPKVTDKIDATINSVLDQYKGKNDDLFNQFARVYATKFTTQELQEMVTFYSSPTGQKLADSALDINNGVKAVMQVYTRNLAREFVAKVRASLKTQGIDL